MQTAQQLSVFENALTAMAAMTGKPLLYGPDGRTLAPTVTYSLRREAARRSGSLKNWNPQEVFSKQIESRERIDIVKRSVDLSNNDPHAAGIIDTFAATVIGAGLNPIPMVDAAAMGIEQGLADLLEATMISVFNRWAPFADAGGRMHFGHIQYLTKVSMLRYGEYFVLLPMLDDPIRPYSLACQVINPMRVKTPVDKASSENIRDGIELGPYGEAKYIWIKKSGTMGRASLPDVSANFLRQPVRKGHRFNVLHGFVCKDPEQVRGMPLIAPAIKYLRDFNDLLNAELVSNVVTAALTYFIEVSGGDDPFNLASRFATTTTTVPGEDGKKKLARYQETYPGAILYGNAGEKPHLLSASRPGITFEPFTKTVKKSISMACNNIPYPVLFKDAEGVNHAGFRSAMLEAWRVFSMERIWHGRDFCQPIDTMLQEEAYLRNELRASFFYVKMHELTRCEWRGAPKGDIEPVKAATTNKILKAMGVKTDARIIAENGDGDFPTTVRQLKEEKAARKAAGLIEEQTNDQKSEEA
jgi:lambda family phage portal protein